MVAVKPAKRPAKNKRPLPKSYRLTRFAQPGGDGWCARVARGLSCWREKRKLTVPLAAREHSIDQTAWYRVERGTFPATTAAHIDSICHAIKLDIVELIKLGSVS